MGDGRLGSLDSFSARRGKRRRDSLSLDLAREEVETARLRFRYRLPLTPGLSANSATKIEPPLIRVLEGRNGPTKYSVAAGAEIDLDPGREGWRKPAEEPSATEADAGPSPRFEATRAATATHGATISATIAPRADLPKLVASRVWLRTSLAGDGSARATAWYRLERHEGSFSVALPPGAILICAFLADNGATSAVDRLANPGSFRVRFPNSTRLGPVVVGIDYEVPARFADSSRIPPSLLDGGVSQWTAWELRVPWSRAAVGAASGWSDANDWSWSGYVFKRRPSRDVAALSSWLAGSDLERAGAAILESTRGDVGANAYLFERTGEPTPLRVWVASRRCWWRFFRERFWRPACSSWSFGRARWLWGASLALSARSRRRMT